MQFKVNQCITVLIMPISHSVKPYCRDITFFRLFKMAAVRHIGFLKVQILTGFNGLRGPIWMNMQNMVLIHPTVAEIWQFSIFQNDSRPASRICFVCLDHPWRYLVVLINLQNLVLGIGAIVLMICKFSYFAR